MTNVPQNWEPSVLVSEPALVFPHEVLAGIWVCIMTYMGFGAINVDMRLHCARLVCFCQEQM